MSGEDMYSKLGIVGERTSGFEKGKSRRGLYGRGAKDVVIFGTTHFESIKDGMYSHLVIHPSLSCKFEAVNQKANPEKRILLGIQKGNGTTVTIEVSSEFRIPRHEGLTDTLSRYYSLRDIMSNPKREISLVDRNRRRTDTLNYKAPEGQIVWNDNVEVPGYPDVKAHLLIRKHATPFNMELLPLREGILIKSGSAIHDCTYFGLEPDTYCWRFTGEMYCDYIDKLVRDYDDREAASDNPIHSTSNPILLLDPNRDGLVEDHPFTQNLKQSCRNVLRSLVDELKSSEAMPKKKVSCEELDRKLDLLSKEVSKLLEKKIKEIEEEVPLGQQRQGDIPNMPIGLHIIPAGEEKIIINKPKTFTVKIVGYTELDDTLPIEITSSEPNVNVGVSPVYLKRFSEDRKSGTTTFVLEGDIIGAEALVDVSYNGFSNVIIVQVIEPPLPNLPLGLSFDKSNYYLKVNKEKALHMWLNSKNAMQTAYHAEILSDRPELVIKGGGKCSLRKTREPGIFFGQCKVVGRRAKIKGMITATMLDFTPAYTQCIVEEKEGSSRLKLEFIPDEEDFGSVRYKWDDDRPYILRIAAKHPSIRQYLGKSIGDTYPGIESQLYHCVLAEVVAEAMAFDVLKRQFRTEGQQGMMDYTSVDATFHKHYSDFLAICHNTLNHDIQGLFTQPSTK